MYSVCVCVRTRTARAWLHMSLGACVYKHTWRPETGSRSLPQLLLLQGKISHRAQSSSIEYLSPCLWVPGAGVTTEPYSACTTWVLRIRSPVLRFVQQVFTHWAIPLGQLWLLLASTVLVRDSNPLPTHASPREAWDLCAVFQTSQGILWLALKVCSAVVLIT